MEQYWRFKRFRALHEGAHFLALGVHFRHIHCVCAFPFNVLYTAGRPAARGNQGYKTRLIDMIHQHF